MIHHPMVFVPKLVVLVAVVVVLAVLHGSLTPGQFRVAVAIGVVVLLAASIVIWTVAAKVLANPDSKLGAGMVLARDETAEARSKAASDKHASLVGRQGVAVSSLHPAGTASIDGRRIAVMTDGEFIEKDAPVRVVRAVGAKVVVTRQEEGSSS